jgi:hypothetical protein
MRSILVLCLLSLAAPALAQDPPSPPEQVVTPTVVGQDRACWRSVPCETPPPCPPVATTLPATPCQPAPTPQPAIHWERRSAALFWSGAALVAGGATLVVGSVTWARESVPVGYPAAPCGTDPYLTRLPIAPCQTSRALLGAGVSLAGGGALLMIYGGERVAVGADGREVKVTVRF